MNANQLSAMCSTFGPAMGNHLWQSTLFALAVGAMCLILRENHARARYALWLAASLKFIIPFSLLIAVGTHLAWTRSSTETKAELYFAVEEFSQPFAPMTVPAISLTPSPSEFARLMHQLPTFLAAVWLCGTLVVLLVWYARWRRVSAAIRLSAPLHEGREVELLRRLERQAGIRQETEVLRSRTLLEPGIFGIGRPVLVWPEGISKRLEEAHLEPIIAHEVWHVRRRDNLTAAMHMMVEAIFWFHPIVWWIGARMMEERERACDEGVLASGCDRQAYAESILKICEFCLGSPLACVAGVTGADLKKRIARIMTEGFARKLDLSRKLLLGGAGLMAFAMPIALGLLNATQTRAQSKTQSMAAVAPGFEASSIGPSKSSDSKDHYEFLTDKFSGTNLTLQRIVQFAYGVEDPQITGGPSWLNSEKFDIDLKISQSTAESLRKLDDPQRFLEWRRMVQTIVADRFKLTLHRETKPVPGYALVIAKGGPKLHEAKPGDTYPNGLSSPSGPTGAGTMHQGIGQLTVQALPMKYVTRLLTEQLGRSVEDRTGLASSYDFNLSWAPDESQPPPFRGTTPSSNSSGPSIYRAIQEQLGLKLEPQEVPVEILVIDHAEMPSESQARGTTVVAPVYQDSSIKENKVSNEILKTGKGIISQRISFTAGEITMTSTALQYLVRMAYGVEDYQISGAPNWLTSALYDVEGKADKSVIAAMKELGNDQRDVENRKMLQALLEDRLKLKYHRETRDMPIYSLVVVNAGKLHEAQGDCGLPSNGPQPLGDPGKLPCGHLMRFFRGGLAGQKVPISRLVASLSEITKRMVLNKTNLAGRYDINLKWTEVAQSQASTESAQSGVASKPADPLASTLLSALQEQLGLKLESQIAPVETFVIDQVEKPAESQASSVASIAPGA